MEWLQPNEWSSRLLSEYICVARKNLDLSLQWYQSLIAWMVMLSSQASMVLLLWLVFPHTSGRYHTFWHGHAHPWTVWANSIWIWEYYGLSYLWKNDLQQAHHVTLLWPSLHLLSLSIWEELHHNSFWIIFRQWSDMNFEVDLRLNALHCLEFQCFGNNPSWR